MTFLLCGLEGLGLRSVGSIAELELSMVGVIQRFPGRSLHRMPWCFRPVRPDGALGRMFHASGVERRAPASIVVLSQLEVEALTVHSGGYVTDAGPRVEPGAQGPERAVV